MASEIDEAGTAPAGAAPEEPEDGRQRQWLDRLHLWALVELFVLSGFAIAQPLLDVTGKSPDFFLFRRADRLDIIALVLGVILLPALCIWGVEVAVAVNGVIAGVSETFREVRDAQGSEPKGPPDKFSAVTLDTLFKKGDNRLELFVVDDSGGKVRLRPLTVS